jgi:hypothetical protein
MWDRSRLMRADSVWVYDLRHNRWKNMRPGREPALNVGKGVQWDPNAQVFWVYDTKLRVYDPHANTWTVVSRPPMGKRTYFGFALDPRRNKIVMFGDHYRSDEQTRVYDIATDTWTDAEPATHPPGARACPTMVYDSVNDVMICVTLAGKWDTKDDAQRRMETWVYKIDNNTWTRMNPPDEPDYSGTRGRLMWFLPDFNIVILEGRTRKEQQIWTYRYANPPEQAPPQVPIPQRVTVVTLKGGKARLDWEPVTAGKLQGYRVYRAAGTEPWKLKYRPVTPDPIRGTTFVDTGLKTAATYHYHVVAIADGRQSEPSLRIRTQPALVEGVFASTLATDKVLLRWKPAQAKDVTGYFVERAVVETIAAGQIKPTRGRYDDPRALAAVARRSALGPFIRLNKSPLTVCEHTDRVDLTKPATFDPEERTWRDYIGGGKGPRAEPKTYDMSADGCPYAVYAYRVRALNRLGVVGGPSPYQLTVPTEVEGLFSREEGSGVSLRWSASPHKRIRGYLVYREDGRWDTSEISRLTPEPIDELSFVDRTAGGKSRRYHVVAVDALGQEGVPSAPAWGFRPWRTHYSPWLPPDGWHQ